MYDKTLPFALAAVLILAGCMGTPESPEPSTDERDNDPRREATDNHDPILDVPPEASIQLAADMTEGSIPLMVSFHLGSTGLDGRNLTWTLDATGDRNPDAEGKSLPANVTHTYREPGEFRATFTVETEGSASETSLTIRAIPLESWYLTWEEDDEDPLGCGEASMSRDHPGESAECNERGAIFSKILSYLGDPVWASFSATEPTHGFPAGTSLEGVLHLATIGAGTGNATIELLADGGVVAQMVKEIDDAPRIPDPGETTRNVSISFDMKTETHFDEEAELTFRVALNTLEHWHLQSHENRTSGFTIGGAHLEDS